MAKVQDFLISVRDAEMALKLPPRSINHHNMERRIELDGTVRLWAVDVANALKTERRRAATIFRALEIWRLAQ